MADIIPNLQRSKLSQPDFRQMGDFIHAHLGIKMPDQKRGMVESRLHKRLRSLGCRDYHAYKNYLFSTEGRKKELPKFIDAVTTNKTDFFREPRHFDYLAGTAVPALLKSKQAKGTPLLSCWSCACSRGDEPYSLAMVLQELVERDGGFNFTVTASDISSQILEKAVNAVYEHDIIEPVPIALRRKYLLRSKDRSKDLVRIAPAIRSRVNFRQINLIREFPFKTAFDVIFCRNVTIYFDAPTTDCLIRKLCMHLKPGDSFLWGIQRC